MSTLKENFYAITQGKCSDPFKVLGPHSAKKTWVVRCWQPQATRVELLDHNDQVIAILKLAHCDGLFEARMPLPSVAYRLRLFEAEQSRVIDDPYCFPSPLGDLDRHLMKEGSLQRLEQKLGANTMELDGIDGVNFAVWAPNAARVSIIGGFNQWDGCRHPMRRHPQNGIWDIFIPGLAPGEHYKFELLDENMQILPLKSDPFARFMEASPGNASIVHQDDYQWQDMDWIHRRKQNTTLKQPMSIYEVHLGSWCRHDGNQPLSYRELAVRLVNYACEMAYTHIELLPLTEHPFDGSWGYQPVGLFAPTSRFGKPEDLKYFIDACHQRDIGVIMDWVPAHFPRDDFGLGRFDGSHLYEHADPRQGAHPDWGTLIFNLSRPEVINYLLANATFWVEEYHIDALRVDAVASMLYLDYSREAGEWIPNRYGGNENLEAVDFLRRMNEQVHACGAVTIAEESTSWPLVSYPVYQGGLGFSYKWNMGWMHDTLDYFSQDPVHRRYHHDKLTFGLLYAFNENFILPLSHDEVVHGKGSIFTRMPGDRWQVFANIRLYYSFMYGYPGKKLLFMGCEFAQIREWDHDSSLDWHLLEQPEHAGIKRLVQDLNRLYQNTPALYEMDLSQDGFEWIDCADSDQGIISYIRRGKNPDDFVVVVCNMTPVVRHGYGIGAPTAGYYVELLNSDATEYRGSGVGNLGMLCADQPGLHGKEHSFKVSLPPLATLILKPVKQ